MTVQYSTGSSVCHDVIEYLVKSERREANPRTIQVIDDRIWRVGSLQQGPKNRVSEARGVEIVSQETNDFLELVQMINGLRARRKVMMSMER